MATPIVNIVVNIIIVSEPTPPRKTAVILIFTKIVNPVVISIYIVTVRVVTPIRAIIIAIVRHVIRKEPTTDFTKIRTTVTAFHTLRVATTANSTPIPTKSTKFIIDMYIV